MGTLFLARIDSVDYAGCYGDVGGVIMGDGVSILSDPFISRELDVLLALVTPEGVDGDWIVFKLAV